METEKLTKNRDDDDFFFFFWLDNVYYLLLNIKVENLIKAINILIKCVKSSNRQYQIIGFRTAQTV